MNNILLIDDDRAFNKSLKKYLEYEGFEVICAFDGKQGLSLIHKEKPDLIITDIVMPEIEGIEIINKLTENPLTSSIKLIAISGGGRIGGQEYLKLAKRLGAEYVFDKPLDITALVEAIRKLLH